MRVVLLLATLLLVSLAGCVSDDGPEPAGTSDAAAAKPSGDGASKATPANEASVEASEEVAVIEPYKEAFEGAGSTSTGAWVCDDTTGAGECNGHEIDAGSRFVTIDYTDHMMAMSMVMTWERLDNTYRFLVARIHAIPADGGEPVLLHSGFATSPYEIDIPEAHVGPGTIEIEVWPRSDAGIGPAFVFVDPQTQPFDITGDLILMPGM